MQGRRDFTFGLDQAKRLYSGLKGPRRLWIGNLGHAPSAFPAADSIAMAAQGRQWFDRFLRGARNGIEKRRPIVLANQGKASTRAFAKLPATGSIVYRGTLNDTITPDNSAIIRNPALDSATEVFGAPVVRVTADARGGWSRIVAQMTAHTPSGGRIVVSSGGVPTTPGKRTYAIRLIDQVTAVPKGSSLEVTLSTSNAQYLDVPMPDSARLSVSDVEVTVPTLG